MNMMSFALLALAPILVWRVYARLKALMQRQRSVPTRHWSSVLMFGSVLLMMGLSLKDMNSVGYLLGGAVLGAGWAVFGLRTSTLEADGHFTPNARLGVMIPMFYTARVLYVGFDVVAKQQGGMALIADLTSHPISLAALGLLCAYFACFSAGLLRWRTKIG